MTLIYGFWCKKLKTKEMNRVLSIEPSIKESRSQIGKCTLEVFCIYPNRVNLLGLALFEKGHFYERDFLYEMTLF